MKCLLTSAMTNQEMHIKRLPLLTLYLIVDSVSLEVSKQYDWSFYNSVASNLLFQVVY